MVHAPKAIKELARLATASESDAARVSAIKELLDRGFGRAPQAHTGEDGDGPIKHIFEIAWQGNSGSRENGS